MSTCQPCLDGEHADDGSGEDCPCCGVFVPEEPMYLSGSGEVETDSYINYLNNC